MKKVLLKYSKIIFRAFLETPHDKLSGLNIILKNSEDTFPSTIQFKRELNEEIIKEIEKKQNYCSAIMKKKKKKKNILFKNELNSQKIKNIGIEKSMGLKEILSSKGDFSLIDESHFYVFIDNIFNMNYNSLNNFYTIKIIIKAYFTKFG